MNNLARKINQHPISNSPYQMWPLFFIFRAHSLLYANDSLCHFGRGYHSAGICLK